MTGTETEMVEGDLGLLPLICHVVVAEQMSQDATTLVADTEIDPGRLQGANAKERVADRVHPENKITDTPAGARQDA